MESEIEKPSALTEKLSKIAKTSQQNAYSCYTKGNENKLSFLTRTTPEAVNKMDEMEKNVRQQLVSSIKGNKGFCFCATEGFTVDCINYCCSVGFLVLEL